MLYPFKGYFNCDSCCDLQIIRKKNKVFVILTELSKNKGTSITNAYENIATQVYHEYLQNIPIDQICWIEHYTDESFGGKSRKQKNGKSEETFDIVQLSWNDDIKKFYAPSWRKCDKETLSQIVTMH